MQWIVLGMVVLGVLVAIYSPRLVAATFAGIVLIALLLQFMSIGIAIPLALSVAMFIAAAYAWRYGIGARLGQAVIGRRAGGDAVAVPVRHVEAHGTVPDAVRALGHRPLYLVVGRGRAELWRHAPVRLVPAVRLDVATLRRASEIDRDPEGWMSVKDRGMRLQFTSWHLLLDVRHRVDATEAVRRLDPGPGRRPTTSR